MKNASLCFAFLTVSSTAALGQQWQRPENCPAPQLSAFGSSSAPPCGGYLCKALSVSVTVNRDGTCTSSIAVSDLHMVRGTARRANWSIDSVGDCAAGQCQFDPSDGIYVIYAPRGELRDPVKGLTSWGLWDMNTPGITMRYEAHVLRKNDSGNFVSCCPVDPRIVND